jgi:hypothetical protein
MIYSGDDFYDDDVTSGEYADADTDDDSEYDDDDDDYTYGDGEYDDSPIG